MRASELRPLASEELVQKGKEVREELFNAKIRHATGQLEETAKLSKLRSDVARIETILRERREANK